jgi:hypothetical protein
MTRVDHIVVSVAELPSAIARWRTAGLPPTLGGRHPWGTSNALVRGPDRGYLELITADDGDDPVAIRVRTAPGPLSWGPGRRRHRADAPDAARARVPAGPGGGQLTHHTGRRPAELAARRRG